MTYLSRVRRTLMAGAAFMLLATLTLTAPPADAQTDEPATDAPMSSEDLSCDVSLDKKLVMIPAVWPDGRIVDRHESKVIRLDQPLHGRVVASGVTGDLAHLEDQLDFSFRLTQFEEQINVQFLDDDGEVIAETPATPDLPDLAPYAAFNLPSVDLDRPAVAVKIVHAGVTEGEPNSIGVPCVNFKELGPDSHPSEFVEMSLCPADYPSPFETHCGFFSVPEDRSDAHSRLISVAFAVVPGDGSHVDPLVYLEGGPGFGSVTFSPIAHELAMAPIADGRDVIYVDQRGTGLSQPNLTCVTERLMAGPPPPFPSPDDPFAFDVELTQSCFDDLRAEGVDIDAYTTPENADDVADLRIALGIGEWNLFGGSYGTNLGLSIMRDRPEGIRSVVLDSVFPPEVGVVVPGGQDDQAIGFLKALDAIVERCESDPGCSSEIPDLRQDIIDAERNLDAEPVVVTGTAVEFLAGVPELFVDGHEWLHITTFDFANPNFAATTHALASDDPRVRSEALHNYFRATMLFVIGLPLPEQEVMLAQLRFGVPGPANGFSEGFNNTVLCAEELGHPNPATTYDGPSWPEEIETFAEHLVTPFYEAVCEASDVAPADPIVSEPITSDIPTLVTYTDNDWQTVPEWSELAASRLTNADLVFFPNLNHVVTFANPCPHAVVGQFISAPGSDLDTSCIDDLPPISYSGTLPDIPPFPPIDEFFAQLEEGPSPT